MERDREVGTQGPAEFRVAVRFVAADAVVHVGGFEIEGEFRASEEMDQSDRVGAAGKSHQHPMGDQVGEGGLEMFNKLDRIHASY